MDLRKRNAAELEIDSSLTKNIADKMNKGMTLLGVFVGGVNGWTQVYYFYNSDKDNILDGQANDENGEANYDITLLLVVEEQFDLRKEGRGVICPKVKKYSIFEMELNNHDATTGYPEKLLEEHQAELLIEKIFYKGQIYQNLEELKNNIKKGENNVNQRRN